MARELTTLIESRGKPAMIVSDNGTEFSANAMLAWTEEHDITWHAHGRFHAPHENELSFVDAQRRAMAIQQFVASASDRDSKRSKWSEHHVYSVVHGTHALIRTTGSQTLPRGT